MLLNIFYTAGIFVLSIALALSQFVLNVLAFKQKKNAMETFPVYYIYFFKFLKCDCEYDFLM